MSACRVTGPTIIRTLFHKDQTHSFLTGAILKYWKCLLEIHNHNNCIAIIRIYTYYWVWAHTSVTIGTSHDSGHRFQCSHCRWTVERKQHSCHWQQWQTPVCDTIVYMQRRRQWIKSITITRSVWHHSFTRLLFFMSSFPMAIPVITHLSSWEWKEKYFSSFKVSESKESTVKVLNHQSFYQ